MKKNIRIIYSGVLLMSIMTSFKLTAQVGVYTKTPAENSRFHVDAANDNDLSPTTSQIVNDVVVTKEGHLGVGMLNPVTKVDLRSTDLEKGIIGLGTTNQLPAQAGAGAMAYNDTSKLLSYSDGEKWHEIPVTPPSKVIILANKSTTQTIMQNDTSQHIIGWNKLQDENDNFNASTGIFIAPVDGFYVVSFSVTLANGTIPNNTYLETIIESNSSVENIQSFRSINSYPAYETGTISNEVGGNCNAIFNLKAGNTIRFRLWHNLGTGKSLDTTDSTRNSISIYEL